MILIWTMLVAMAAEACGHCQAGAVARACPAKDTSIRAHHPCPSRSLSVARKVRHRVCSGFATWSGNEEFETEEVDETWIIDLDAIATVPGSWLGLAWCRSRSTAAVFSGLDRIPRCYFPLRC